MSEPTKGPALRVIAGNPTPEEVAVLVSVIGAVAAAAEPEPEPVRLNNWSNRARALGRMPAPGPTTWRDSSLPR